MHDSGNRESFSTGAVRDTASDKPRPDLFSPFAEERVGHWLRLGAVKYAERNWERGIPNSRCFASLRRHVMRYQQGNKSEDHLAAIIFNAMAIIHNQEMIRRGVLPAELDDMPDYGPKLANNSHKSPMYANISKTCFCPLDIPHIRQMSAENSENVA